MNPQEAPLSSWGDSKSIVLLEQNMKNFMALLLLVLGLASQIVAAIYETLES
jgi:hypothetical protein